MRQIVAGMAALFLVLAAAVVINFSITDYQVRHSQQTWCTALDLLTAHPVPSPADPAANPSRVNAYVYYRTFLGLHQRFGC